MLKGQGIKYCLAALLFIADVHLLFLNALKHGSIPQKGERIKYLTHRLYVFLMHEHTV